MSDRVLMSCVMGGDEMMVVIEALKDGTIYLRVVGAVHQATERCGSR